MQRTLDCGCGHIHNGVTERPRYFPRQLITPDDMNLEQDYFRDRLRRHNRFLHGWGVVCGAEVCEAVETGSDGTATKKPWTVVIQPGYVLGPYGDEIYIDCPREVDVRTSGVSAVTGDALAGADDPWCVPVRTARTAGGTVYVGVRYQQVATRKVPVHPVGCGCDDSPCEASRWCDGFEICVLDKCPDSRAGSAPLQMVSASAHGVEAFVGGRSPACPGKVEDDCVVLAKVTFDADGTFVAPDGERPIDNCACRRNVLGFGHVWWGCGDAGPASPAPREDACAIEVNRIVVRTLRSDGAGQQEQVVVEIRCVDGTAQTPVEISVAVGNVLEFELEGSGFRCGDTDDPTVLLGEGLFPGSIGVESVNLLNSSQRLRFGVVVDYSGATPVDRPLNIVNAEGRHWRCDRMVRITP